MNPEKSPYINIHRIEFVVTHWCSGKCRHCSVGEQLNLPERTKHVLSQKAIETIQNLSALFNVTSVMTFGGEPLLFPDVVCAIHKKSADCGIAARQLITNGYFTKNKERCAEVAKKLAAAGINNLLISVDAFHQETIPIEAVYQFAHAVVAAGIEGVSLQPAWVVNEDNDNVYNAETREVLSRFSNLGIPINGGNNIFMAGNAARYLAEYYPKPNLNLSDQCGSMPYTDPLTQISSLSIVPNGDVMICNFVIGNIYTEDIAEIVARYNPYKNKYVRAILEGGAKGLLSCAKKTGIAIDTAQCYSICDICHKITAQTTQQ